MSEDSSKTKSAEEKKAELLGSIEDFKRTYTRQLNGRGPNVLIHVTQEVINNAVRAGLSDYEIKSLTPISNKLNLEPGELSPVIKVSQFIREVPEELIKNRREKRADSLTSPVCAAKPVELKTPIDTEQYLTQKQIRSENVFQEVMYFILKSLKFKDSDLGVKSSISTKKVFAWGVPTLLICFASYFYLWPGIITWIDKDHLVQGVENNKSIAKNGNLSGKKLKPSEVSSSGKTLPATSSARVSVTNTVTIAKQSIGGTSPPKSVMNSTQTFADNIRESREKEARERERVTPQLTPPPVTPAYPGSAGKVPVPQEVVIPKSQSKKSLTKAKTSESFKAKPGPKKIVKVKPKKIDKLKEKKKAEEFKPLHITKRVG